MQHPPEWHELKGFYFGEARAERIRRQIAAVGGADHMEVVIPENFKGERPRENARLRPVKRLGRDPGQ